MRVVASALVASGNGLIKPVPNVVFGFGSAIISYILGKYLSIDTSIAAQEIQPDCEPSPHFMRLINHFYLFSARMIWIGCKRL